MHAAAVLSEPHPFRATSLPAAQLTVLLGARQFLLASRSFCTRASLWRESSDRWRRESLWRSPAGPAEVSASTGFPASSCWIVLIKQDHHIGANTPSRSLERRRWAILSEWYRGDSSRAMFPRRDRPTENCQPSGAGWMCPVSRRRRRLQTLRRGQFV